MMVQPAFAVSETTQKLLKNFSQISDHLFLAAGQQQKTIGPGDTSHVLALATFPEAWPKETAIYNLATFLGALSTFEKPVIQFEKEAMVITGDKGSTLRIKHRYSDPTTIQPIKDKVLPTDNAAVQFCLSHRNLSLIKKTASLLRLTHFNVDVTPTGVMMTATDPKNPSAHAFDLAIPLTPEQQQAYDAAFSRVFRLSVADISPLLDGDYTVSLAKWPYAYFAHMTAPVTYFLAEDTTKK
jgi:hypothetical protein